MRNSLKKILIFLPCWFLIGMLWGQVTLIVDAVPANTPATDSLYIAGDFNGWNPGDNGYQLTQSPSQQQYTVVITGGNGNIQYKFTRGSWATVEGTASGGVRPNRTLSYSNGDTVYVQIAGWEDLGGGSNPNSTAQPNVQILSSSFFMPQLNRNRRVWVYLPPDYATSGQAYPVLYMHDGQNVFDATTSFSGEWEVDETLNALHAAGDPGIIVVAVDNGGGDRLNEYSPWVNPTYGGGQGAEYADFLVQTLKPHIDSLFRTQPQREHTGIMGSSMGGLISTYAGIEYQEVFGKVGAFSPAYWFAGASAFAQVTQTGKEADMRIYQLIGSLEGASYVADMERMEDSLLAGGFTAAEVLSVAKADGQHSEWFWAREFAAAYLWLFQQDSTATSLEENPAAFGQLELFPNPVQDQVELRFTHAANGPVQLELLDTLGRSYGQKTFESLPPGHQTLRWDLQSLPVPAGFYLLRISSQGGTATRKFIYAPRD